MKRNVINQLEQLKNKMSGYAALLVYRYGNLCVEADPLSLLPVEVFVEGQAMKMEEVAQVAVHEKVHFIINPIYEEDIFAIGQAIQQQHPEFKQEVRTFEGYDDDDPEGKYIFCTMPPVDSDRRKVLLTAVDALYQECKVQMEVAEATCTQKLAVLQEGSTDKEIDRAKEYRETVVKQFTEMRETTYKDKVAEIEAAYQEQQKERSTNEQTREEEEAAHDEKKGLSMNLFDGDNE